MKKLAVILSLLAGSTFARINTMEDNIDHLQRIEIEKTEGNEVVRLVQYPGIGNQSFTRPDCVLLNSKFVFMSEDKIERLKEAVVVSDGSGIMFPEPHFEINDLDQDIKQSVNGDRIVFPLKTLGTYVTGLRIKSAIEGKTLKEAFVHALGRGGDQVELIFLRGCEI